MEQQVFKCQGMVERGLNAKQMIITEFTNKHKIDAADTGKHLSRLYDRIDHLQAQIQDLQNQNYAPSMDRGRSDIAVAHLHVTVGKVVYVHDKVDEILLEIEVHSLVKHLEAVCPGSGKTIVEEALIKRKSKKNSGAGKAFTSA
ncbi:Gibberellin 2-beta-dioxygenase 8 [Hordeum vulgare]|nr:Gibberellin 2-beta-dioxygenase 8 [Hordeum vulgare]